MGTSLIADRAHNALLNALSALRHQRLAVPAVQDITSLGGIPVLNVPRAALLATLALSVHLVSHQVTKLLARVVIQSVLATVPLALRQIHALPVMLGIILALTTLNVLHAL